MIINVLFGFVTILLLAVLSVFTIRWVNNSMQVLGKYDFCGIFCIVFIYVYITNHYLSFLFSLFSGYFIG